MARMSCFPTLLAGKRRKKHGKVADAKKLGGNDCPKVKPVEFVDAPAAAECWGKVAPRDDVKVAARPATDAVAVAVAVAVGEGADQFVCKKASPKSGDLSDFDFGVPAAKKPVGSDGGGEEEKAPGAAVVADDPSPKLKRSCSNIETKRPGPRDAPPLMPARSRSYGDVGDLLLGGAALEPTATPHGGAPEASPASVKTSRTADRVMLKKRSSSQVLPSRSRKLWWRLFLWSHRNLHRPPSSARPAEACSPGRRGGYTSDTLEEGPGAAAADRKNKKVMVDDSPPPPSVPNQWVAFSADNSLHDRVSAWVSSIENEPPFRIAEEDDDDRYDGGDDIEEDDGECAAARPRHLELGESSSGRGHGKSSRRDEVVQANTIVQSLNALSSVAHISGMGLKVVPMIAPFSSLRAVNLSSNFIVHISPGSLPKGLHSLDLSRNKIANIEGLRELTKLRVLNLSYNRISRIGHGLSNCTAIRELYLAGNKISDVEGLHRLLKLAVLDLSFNKITTAKALGQLVANYHSLLALNLVGNPVQANVGDDALRRAVTGLLPSLAYLNKQPVKPQRSGAREVATDSVARAALGGGGSGARSLRKKRASRRLSQSPSSSSLARGRGGSGELAARRRPRAGAMLPPAGRSS